MWPFDRSLHPDLVRAGPLAVERWADSRAGLRLVNRQALPDVRRQPPESLIDAVRSLFPQQPTGKVTLLLESAWLPLLLADTGTRIWSPAQIQALLRHRLSLLYDDGADPVSTWELRVQYRPGDRFALGYGLSPPVRQAMMTAGQAAGLQWAAMVPAWDWGWQRLRRSRRRHPGASWWLWPEQDRMLITRLRRGQMVGLNAGAALTDEPRSIEALVDIEGIRLGVEVQAAPIDMATWADSPPTSPGVGRLTWHALCLRGAASSVTADGPVNLPSGAPA